MKEIIDNIKGFIFSLGIGDYFFFIGTFLLIILLIYIVYLIKCSDIEKVNEEKNDIFDLEAVTKDIEKNYKPENIKLTSYEIEQENNAVISYQELLKNKNNSKINYDDEYTSSIDNLMIKKFDLNASDNLEIENDKIDIKLMSYDQEEKFLKTLKELQNNLSK